MCRHSRLSVLYSCALMPWAALPSLVRFIDLRYHLLVVVATAAMHAGIVIKNNTNQRYATTAVTSFMFRELSKVAGVPVQNFVVRQDMGCGSTIGPIVATRLGLRTVDVGVPQLSMHSCREMCGTDDVAHAVKFFGSFYGAFPTVDASIEGSE